MKQLFVLLLFASINSYCCDCKIISKEKEYINSDFIFLGKIISVTDAYFEIKVIEVFKGKTIEKIRSYKSGCSIYPKKGEIWLLYSKSNNKNDYFISACGNSRSFTKPFALNGQNLPAPPSLQSTSALNEKKDFKIAVQQLKSDITKLRQVKKNNGAKLS